MEFLNLDFGKAGHVMILPNQVKSLIVKRLGEKYIVELEDVNNRVNIFECDKCEISILEVE